MMNAAPCRFCGSTDTDHICLFCLPCGAYTRHEKDKRGRWRCVSCRERAKALKVRHLGYGMFVMRRLDLGVYGPRPEKRTKDQPKLDDLYRDE